MNLQPGQILADKYRILRLLGQGGMGAVYEGENFRIHRRVAIKTLHAQVASQHDVLSRFEREAQAAGRIGSKHIVEVLDLGDLPDGARFMVMEYLDGSTLSDRIKSCGRIGPREVVPIMLDLLEGLQAAHDAGIIHRDLKPANVFLQLQRGAPDAVKILDFGVSKFSSVLGADEMSMTKTGAVMGTPYYMSPEQAKGARGVDHRSDVYSAGVILYEAITGQVPFSAETFNELIFKIALDAPPPAEQFVPSLDPMFGSILRKAMAREPGDRYQSAIEFGEALDGWARAFDAGGAGVAVAHEPPRLMAPREPMASAPVAIPEARPTGLGSTVVMRPGERATSPSPPSTPLGFSQPGPSAVPVAQPIATQPPPKNRMLIVGVMATTALLLGAGVAFLAVGPKSAPGVQVSATPASATASATAASSALANKDPEPKSTTQAPVESAASAPAASVSATSTSSATTPRWSANPSAIVRAPSSTATSTSTSTATTSPTETREIKPEL
ncbi:MAG: serine/threonine-protein kinase [Polyangiaceae bacterium]